MVAPAHLMHDSKHSSVDYKEVQMTAMILEAKVKNFYAENLS